MIGVEIGRVLVASMHQAIADELPTRVDFYDHWLGGKRMRDGSVGLAPMSAVLGFLRAEGDAYHPLMRRAGRYAADWTVASMPALERRVVLAMPKWLRLRSALRLAARTIRAGYEPTKVKIRTERGGARVEIKDSLFCRVREARSAALCDFHAALIVQLLSQMNVQASITIEECAGAHGFQCVLAIALGADE